MPKPKPTPAPPPSNDQLLAAIERSICHHHRVERPAESLSSIKPHLGLPHNGSTTLQLRPKLKELEATGLIEKSHRRSVPLWGLTDKGDRHLAAIRSELTLPESPQHQTWREGRAAASQRIAGFRSDVRTLLDEAVELLEANPDANSAAWFDATDRLNDACRRLASATYCLQEWSEPDDSAPDIDNAPHGQASRRSWWAWSRD